MKFTYIIDQNYQSISSFLLEKKYSQKLIKAIKNQGGKILVNNNEKKMNDNLKCGDYLLVEHPKEVLTDSFPMSNKELNIIYEDDYLLIISKPSHIESIPSFSNNDDTIANRIKYYFYLSNIVSNVHIITRLDKETSGLVLVAKSRYVHHLFGNHVNITKKYLALVTGILEKDIMIEKNIDRIKKDEIKRTVSDRGKYAKTFVRVIKHFGDSTLVECELFTGRTHQIRVHLSYLGHPIIGDLLYEGKENDRLCLHCHKLSFFHPLINKSLTITDFEGGFYDRDIEKDL